MKRIENVVFMIIRIMAVEYLMTQIVVIDQLFV